MIEREATMPRSRTMARMSISCAHEMLEQEGILPRELRNYETFEAYVALKAPDDVKERHGMLTIGVDTYFQFHRKFDPNKEENGRRSLQAWAGPKVAQDESREAKRPRFDRRGLFDKGDITRCWKISPKIGDFIHNPDLQSNRIIRKSNPEQKPAYRSPNQELWLSGRKVSWDEEQYEGLLGTDYNYQNRSPWQQTQQKTANSSPGRFSFDKLLTGKSQYQDYLMAGTGAN
jgi:hypothetical protein